MSPPHIKVGLVKQFAKALKNEGEVFKGISNMFPHLSIAKIKDHIFTGPDVRKMFQSQECEEKMKSNDRNA